MRDAAARIKAAIDPLAFYRVEIPTMPPPTRDRGWVNGGLCPFHDDNRPRNFRVNLDTGAFVCFSCGTRGGDVISFTQIRHRISFPNALEALGEAWGVRA